MRLGVVFDVIFLYFYVKKKVLRREFSGLREVLFVSAGLAFSIYRVACRYYFMYDTNCLLDVK